MQVLKEETQEGLVALVGETVTIFACRYIYTGKLVGVGDSCVKLENPKIVYETGSLDDKDWADAQSLPHQFFYVATGAIESFGLMK
jgi:hypothetical protein